MWAVRVDEAADPGGATGRGYQTATGPHVTERMALVHIQSEVPLSRILAWAIHWLVTV